MNQTTLPLMTRLMRGAALTSGGFVIAQALRFGSNLILARLLFPEAFGLMALLTMILMGLQLLSDTGVQQSIMGNPRGDDPDFLNTAWTLNVARGFVLWLLACALAWPAAQFYAAPELIQIIPVGALALILSGLAPTGIYTAQRHLVLGRIVIIELAAQIVGIVLMIALAWATGSVWALVWGGLATALVKLVLEWMYLAGFGNRLRWDPDSARTLLTFGGWIMLSSAFAFLIAQGDRAVLGRALSIEGLGIYNIAWFLASFPMMLGTALIGRLLIPAYRESMSDAAQNHRIRRMRMGLTGGIAALLFLLALIGPWLIGVLYDDRYTLAGPIMVMIAAASLVPLVTLTYDQAALARGESRRFFEMMALRASLHLGLFIAGVAFAGLPGALAGQALAAVIAYPFMARFAHQMGVWDKRHDLIWSIFALFAGGIALALHLDQILALLDPI